MNYTYKIFTCFLISLLSLSASFAQTQYWDSEFSPQKKRKASLYSEEVEKEGVIYRTYFDITSKQKVGKERLSLGKKPRLLERELYTYFSNGNLKSQHTFIIEAGEMRKSFLHDAKTQQTKTRTNFLFSTQFIQYFENGNKRISKTYEQANKKASSQAWYSNGKPRILRNASGSILEARYPDGSLSLKSDSLMEDGSTGFFRWDRKGVLREEAYARNGKLNGIHKHYFPDGVPSAIGQNSDGHFSGVWKFYTSQKSVVIVKEVNMDQLPLKERNSATGSAIFTKIFGKKRVDMFYEEGFPRINEFVRIDQEPIPTNVNHIKQTVGYPQAALDYGIQGFVVFRVLVDTEGKPVDYRIVNKVHPLLTNSIEMHIMDMKFSPASIDGKKIPFWVNIPFNFKLLN